MYSTNTWGNPEFVWPAICVICLGVRTVSVLSVAKKVVALPALARSVWPRTARTQAGFDLGKGKSRSKTTYAHSKDEGNDHGQRGMKRGAAEKMRVPRRAWSKKICTRRSPWYPRKKEVRKRRCRFHESLRKVDGQMLLNSTGLRRHQPQMQEHHRSTFGAWCNRLHTCQPQ